MSAYENSVQETIVMRIENACAQNKKMSNDTLLMLRARLFDYAEEGTEIDNKNFFPPAIKKILDKQIEKAQAQIIAIHSPQFYAENKSKSINPEIKAKLLSEINALFLDQDGQVKQCFIDAFGGENRIQALFNTIEFRDVNDVVIEAATDPMHKFKSFLINAYYEHYQQELGLQAINIPVEEGSIFHIAKQLAEGKSIEMVMENAPDVYQLYLKQARFLDTERALATAPEIKPLTDLLEDDISPEHSATVEEDIDSLMAQSQAIYQDAMVQEPHYYSSADSTSFFSRSRQCSNPSAKEDLRLPKPVNASAAEEGCRIS